MKFINYILSWLAAPALLAEKDKQIAELKDRIENLESERSKLQDTFLLKNGAYPINPDPLPPPTQQEDPSVFEQWKKYDIKRELNELDALAQQDPQVYGPLLEEALIRYREDLQ